GYDPWLHTKDGAERLEKAAMRAGGHGQAVAVNPLDAVWSNRPMPPRAPAMLHDLGFAGESAQEKIVRVQAALAKERCDGLMISDPHALCWLLNIRGGDLPHSPLMLGYGFVPAKGRAVLFAAPEKFGPAVRNEISALCDLRAADDFPFGLEALLQREQKIRLDAATAGVALVTVLESWGVKADVGADPIARMKAAKNAVELDGARKAHVRDGVAMARFLHWFDDHAPHGQLDEITVAETLEDFRRETNLLHDLSFPSISAAGPHAAMPHYRVTRASNRAVTPGIFLIDSGAQYRDGTTDITRTLAVGDVTCMMRDRYTRVLKGHIAIATAVFPKGTTGGQIDALARLPLWQAGLDFDHGTGHGIGSFLSVHEGPQRIAKVSTAPLEPGMIVSNEPGYYEEGAFGIRIENLLIVEKRAIAGGNREMYGFETITLAPIDTRLIDSSLMTRDEIAWLDAYHARVRESLAPQLEGTALAWLMQATEPLAVS
ncbi:MAG: aminopeptidase family protein P, partial [Beijerinckiaceae bacterium]